MVGSPELVRSEEIGDVVVEAAVFERQGLDRVDVPDIGPGDGVEGRCIRACTVGFVRGVEGEDVVEAARARTIDIRGFVRLLRSDVLVSGLVEDLHRVLLSIGIEIAEEVDQVAVRCLLLVTGKPDERFGLLHAVGVRRALTVAAVLIART